MFPLLALPVARFLHGFLLVGVLPRLFKSVDKARRDLDAALERCEELETEAATLRKESAAGGGRKTGLRLSFYLKKRGGRGGGGGGSVTGLFFCPRLHT